MERQHYDVIIVGGGSAGCAAAARLSEDPARHVLLLEAGPDPDPIPEIIADAAAEVRVLLESSYAQMYPTQRKADGSTFVNIAGRVMGGGSSVNALAVVRPIKHDFDTWVALGNSDWSFETCLPVLKRIESEQDFPDNPIHGTDGPLFVKRPFRLDMEASEPVRAFIDRAVEMGLPLCPDLNVPNPYGVCGSAYNVKDGVRQSATVAYLHPARRRPNLHIVADALVTELKISGRRVAQVVYEHAGQTITAAADEVILSAGCYHSPQILLLSGIGPAAELARLGIRPILDLAGVGENYQDHATMQMTYEGHESFRPDWLVPRFRLMIKSDPSLPCGNFHIFMRPPTLIPGLKPMMPVSANLLEQHARGRVYLTSTDPHDLPEIDDAMLQHPDDIEAMTTAMEFIHELVNGPSLQKYYGPLLQPGPKDNWAEFARATYGSYHHGAGTCMMGPASNPMAVVDQRLRVHGLDNLRVADVSIIPTVTHANTNVTALMIGERVADFIRNGE